MKTTRFTKRHWLLITVAVMLFSLMINSCKKDTLDITDHDNNTVQPTSYSSLSQFFEHNGAQSQHFTVDPAIQNTITGAKGVVVVIPANSFVNDNDQPPAGNVQIELKEILSFKDMILSNKPTTSNGIILKSGGEIFFQATNNGDVLKLAPNKNLQISIPNNNPVYGMQLFFASGLDSNFNWSLADTTAGYIYPNPYDSLYSVLLSFIGWEWINCDDFLDDPNPKTYIKIDPVLDTVQTENILMNAFIVFKSINSVMGTSKISDTQYQSYYEVPTQMVVTIVAIGLGETSHKLYFGKLDDVTVTQDLEVNLNISEINEADLINIIMNL